MVVRPEAAVVNLTPFELQVLEVFTGDDRDKGKLLEEKVLVEERKEKTSKLKPGAIGILSQKEVLKYKSYWNPRKHSTLFIISLL